ncbi:uncharacterized protein SCODWIG_00931 [Saccharomycodes ludwigii]|uniref:Fibronectin type-III domain-containing protein n=1 Tax=Saccharomycodes ludwigii TaxID=36035 RepID=A0A376B4V9_9ASCO|nr:uncharacterized protein SCODWIG_00931 [Saccharomycodes ludwigii]
MPTDFNFCITFIALLWLVYRLFKFWTIPISRILSNLNDVEIPHATKIALDLITKDSILIRWENEPFDIISHYILYVNNVKIGEFLNLSQSLYTSCSLKNLNKNMHYKIDLVSVNKQGFRNQPLSLIISLGDKPKSSSMFHWTLQPNGDFSNTKGYSELTSLEKLSSFSIDELKKILTASQDDLHKVLQNKTDLLKNFKLEEQEFLLKISEQKVEYNKEQENKKQIKLRIKNLESEKLKLDLQMEKLTSKTQKLDNSTTTLKGKIASLDKILDECPQIEEQLVVDHKSHKDAIEKEIIELDLHIQDLESSVAKLHNENKNIESTNDDEEDFDVIGFCKEYYRNGEIIEPGLQILKNKKFAVYDKIVYENNSNLQTAQQWNNQLKELNVELQKLENDWQIVDATNRKLRESLMAQPYNSGYSNHFWEEGSPDPQSQAPPEEEEISHLISGVNNIIADNTINLDTDKFTTDQLDNYWNSNARLKLTNKTSMTSLSSAFSAEKNSNGNIPSNSLLSILNPTQQEAPHYWLPRESLPQPTSPPGSPLPRDSPLLAPQNNIWSFKEESPM